MYKRIETFFKYLDEKRSLYTTKDDLYLFFLAVEPELQSKDYGSTMLKDMINKADSSCESNSLPGKCGTLSTH